MRAHSHGPAIEALCERFGAALQSGDSVLDLHSHDESFCDAARPDAVLFVESAEDAADAVAICARHDLPVIPFGSGSGQEGGVVAVDGGLCIDTSRLDRILAVNLADQDCWVEAGVTRLQLARELRGTGLFFPVDPGADASLGGMAATGAAGTTTPRYGAMEDNVLGLEVVLADGTLISTGNRARKSSSGYDLTRLFVGSEGTLGLITKIRLRLHPLPEAAVAVRASFPDVDAAVSVVAEMMGAGMPIARAELMDAGAIRGMRIAGLTDLPERPLLLLEFEGSPAVLGELVGMAGAMCAEAAAEPVELARKTEDISHLWALRHGVAEAEKRLRPGARVLVTDVAVPVSALPAIVADAEARLRAERLMAVLSGHVADGNIHYALLVDWADQDEIARADAFKYWLAERAVALEGTISGEHGIGIGKRKLMALEHGAAMSAMRSIKHALDPAGIFNPGKVLP